ncbi:hypothetical protein BH11PAT2_BH11PAT2_03860 [soil metagenome]
MTDVSFSASLSRANDFTVRLLSGLLNARTDFHSGGCQLTEVSHETPEFTTQRMPFLRVVLSKYRLARFEFAAKIGSDPTSQWSVNEFRHFRVFATKVGISDEIRIAEFEVYRYYFDGEEGQGWSDWKVRSVYVYPINYSSPSLELIPVYLGDDREPIWGTRI